MPAFGTKLTHARLRELAVEAQCDPRTVARVLLGKKVRGSARAQQACERVLRRAGLITDKPEMKEQETRGDADA